MKKLLILAFVFTMAAAGQTQVHRPVPLPSWKDLKFPPLKPVVIPKPETFTLPNGMKVYLLENHELPLMSGVALVRTGNLFDPPDKIGLADLTGTLIRTGGTEKKTGDQLDVELENVAASVESDIGETSGSVSFSCLKDNADQVLGAFKDVLTSPAFREDKLDLSKTQLRSMIARRNDEASGIANREFTNIVYGRNTPYGWMIEYSDLDKIQRQDLVQFYQRYFFPSNVLLAVYGDFSSTEMKAKLESLFADWTVKQPPVPKFPAVEKKPEPGIYLATKTDVTQTYFNIGQLGGEFDDKDFPALAVMSDILGGGFSSRLFKKVRTELGYAYDIGASWAAKYDHPGLFEINGSTQSKDTVPTIEAIRDEVNKIRTSEVTDQELQTAKDTVLNGFVFYFDEPSKTLNRLLQYEYFGYPKDFIFTYQKAVAAVTKADVLRVAKEYLHPEQFTVVAIGNPKQFVTPLSTLGLKETAIDLTIPEPKKETVAANPASTQKGRELLEKAQQALGGADKLAAVKDLSLSAEVAISTGGPGMKIEQKSDYLFPSQMRQE
ncbi:MAG: M16 family metallopeptidase, partial [Candidatus Acidiferrales bacterium]